MAKEPSVAVITSAGHGANRKAEGRAKLTVSAVRKIRTQGEAGRDYGELAREFGVTRGTISCITRGVTWRHVC